MNIANARNEEGAVAVLSVFAISLFLLAIAMLAVDIGSMWVSRRGQIADTDAAALAVAQALTEVPCSSNTSATANELVMDDEITATVLPISYVNGVCDSGAGIVTVETERPASLFFAPLFGVDAASTGATSSAAYGQVRAASNVRPLAICLQELTKLESPASYPNAAYPVYRIPLTGTPDTACVTGEADGDGNIGVIDFDPDSGAAGLKNVNEWIKSGFPGEVDLGSAADGDEDCNNEDGVASDDAPCQGQPRKDLAGLQLDPITCGVTPATGDCLQFYVLVYSDVVPNPDKDKSPGDGANTHYDLASLAHVVLRSYKATGPGDDYIDIELLGDLAEGSKVGAADESGVAPMSVIHCGVDGLYNCDGVLSP